MPFGYREPRTTIGITLWLSISSPCMTSQRRKIVEVAKPKHDERSRLARNGSLHGKDGDSRQQASNSMSQHGKKESHSHRSSLSVHLHRGRRHHHSHHGNSPIGWKSKAIGASLHGTRAHSLVRRGTSAPGTIRTGAASVAKREAEMLLPEVCQQKVEYTDESFINFVY